MLRLVVLTFAFLGWAFFEISGGEATAPDGLMPIKGTQDAGAFGATQTQSSILLEKAPSPLGQTSAPLRSLLSDAAPIGKPNLLDDLLAAESATRPRTGEVSVEGSVGPSQHALSSANVKVVRGNWANLRNGPGKGYRVLASLSRGQRVEILDHQNGWVMLKVLSTGLEGWMAAFLLVDLK